MLKRLLVYFLINGTVHLISDEHLTVEDRIKNKKTQIVFKKFYEGSYFGEVELIFKRQRVYSLQASSRCELYSIRKQVRLDVCFLLIISLGLFQCFSCRVPTHT